MIFEDFVTQELLIQHSPEMLMIWLAANFINIFQPSFSDIFEIVEVFEVAVRCLFPFVLNTDNEIQMT